MNTEDDGLVVSLGVFSAESELRFTADPVVEGATVLVVKRIAEEFSVRLVPAEGASVVRVSVAVGCGDRASSLEMLLTVSGTREPGANVPVTFAVGDASE